MDSRLVSAIIFTRPIPSAATRISTNFHRPIKLIRLFQDSITQLGRQYKPWQPGNHVQARLQYCVALAKQFLLGESIRQWKRASIWHPRCPGNPSCSRHQQFIQTGRRRHIKYQVFSICRRANRRGVVLFYMDPRCALEWQDPLKNVCISLS